MGNAESADYSLRSKKANENYEYFCAVIPSHGEHNIVHSSDHIDGKEIDIAEADIFVIALFLFFDSSSSPLIQLDGNRTAEWKRRRGKARAHSAETITSVCACVCVRERDGHFTTKRRGDYFRLSPPKHLFQLARKARTTKLYKLFRDE